MISIDNIDQVILDFKRKRYFLGLSRKDAAHGAGIAYSTLMDIETGRTKTPRQEHLEKIAKFLDGALSEKINNLTSPKQLSKHQEEELEKSLQHSLTEGLGHLGRYTLPHERVWLAKRIIRDLKGKHESMG